MNRLWAALGSLGLLTAALALPSLQDETCRVTLQLFDGETRRPLPGLVRIVNDAGEVLHPPELLSRGVGLPTEQLIGEWSVVPSGQTVITLPASKVTIAAIAGLETERVERKLDLTGRETAAVDLPLPRFADLHAQGQYNGNTHLHLMKLSREVGDRYLTEIPRADGLDVLFLSYLERADADHDYISNRYTQDDLDRISRGNVPIGNGEEHRHNFGAGDQGYGHVMLLDLPELVLPVSIGPGIMKRGSDGLPIQRGIDQARKSGATVVWCHNHWGLENIPNWVTGRLDAQNIFDGGEHGSYEDSFYRYLNAGLRVPFSTGTDWFLYDFSRVYVPLDGPVTPQSWLASLKAGRSFITNGPLLEFSVDDAKSGDRLDLPAPGEVTVSAKAVGRIDFRQLELIWNGRVLRTSPARAIGGHFAAELRTTLAIDGPGWIALRTPPPSLKKDPDRYLAVNRNEFDQPLFSHTSPIYVAVGGRELFDSTTAKGLLADVERNRELIARTAQFADDEERQRVLFVHDEAISTLKTWIQNRP